MRLVKHSRRQASRGPGVASGRPKLSTTVSPQTFSYLMGMLRAGEAATLAEAVDLSIARLRQVENRERLERDTAAYFESMSPPAQAEESELGAALSGSARGIDFDREP